GYVAFYLESIEFYYTKNIGLIPFIFNVIQVGIVIPLFSMYFYFRRKKMDYETIKEALIVAKTFPNGVSYSHITQRTGLNRKQIEKILQENNLEEDLGLEIKGESLQFKEIKYTKNNVRIEKQFKDIIQMSSRQLTPKQYSSMFRIKKNLEEMLEYYKEIYDKEKEYLIERQIEVITELIENIKLEDLI
ncbi:MAG TPA: hypothetical protein VMX17_10425, partial [Candidatus Glassbacteria bacterium]|nr:hypothetical protein [Candidatus Glassbacteria bacterium]